ncbi:fibrobacter succinogenes major paralogous domain-containing protein [Olleya sp. R77988]|uniref:fibrobacter succinogenes major paralogous domain-containing protein n=1 Tax=Olleya sp. R77988 TaxID=3093875 RepID=UPI0037C6236D
MKKLKLPLIALFALFIFQCSDDDNPETQQDQAITVTDVDGNTYNTITMGSQIWMLENLKTTKYNDGTPITLYTFADFGINWGSVNDQVGHYQWASTEDLNNVVEEELPFDYYGAMYNYFAIESGKLAPEGWRIPTKADFEELESYVASQGHAGNEAKALKTETGWLPSTGGGTNDFGFNGLPNGYVSGVGTPTFGQGVCTWATSDVIEQGTSVGANTRVLVQLFDEGSILYSDNAVQIGAGIRCIKIQ